MKTTDKRHIYRIAITILLLMRLYPAHARDTSVQYNLDMKEGLPSNHVYCAFTDHHGFLWIGTTKGVIKYNGYNTRLFDVASGINNHSVWQISEDHKGRIWLISISNRLGYIYRDRYIKVHLDDSTYIYPRDFINHTNGVAFISSDQHAITNLCIEHNDSIRTFKMPGQNLAHEDCYYLHRSGQLITWTSKGHLYSSVFDGKKVRNTTVGHYRREPCLLFGDHMILRKSHNAKSIKYINVLNGTIGHISCAADEDITVMQYHKSHYYIVTNKRLLKLDSTMQISDAFVYSERNTSTRQIPMKYIFMSDDEVWGRRITTSNKGLFLNLPRSGFHKTSAIPGVHVGYSADSAAFFWDDDRKTLISITPAGKKEEEKYPEQNIIRKIIPYKSGQSLMINKNGFFRLSRKKLSPFFSVGLPMRHIASNTFVGYDRTGIFFNYGMMMDCLVDSNENIYNVETGYGYRVSTRVKDTVISVYMDSSRYSNIVYNARYNAYLLYGGTHLLIHRDSLLYKIAPQTLESVGIDKIEKILVDDHYGNIFLKTSNTLFVYAPATMRLKRIFENYNLSNATIHLYRNKILAAGKFGIACRDILPGMNFGPVGEHINFKGQYYNTAINSFIIGDSLFLETDNAFYAVSLAVNSPRKYMPPYSLFLSSQLHYKNITDGDTVMLTGDEGSPHFEFINPYGTGVVRYSYTIEGSGFSPMTRSEEIKLPVLEHGVYHTMKISVSDDIWRTRPYTIYLYVQPDWWETDKGKNTIIALVLLSIIAVSTIAILTTRYLITQKYRRQQRYLELELKSIYAQLNPHFIFNSLNNIVYFIKKNKNQEAHKYLTAFANLLRFYIRSSREKWVNIKEEAENLNNYIMLQQSRFDHRFDYDIYIAPNIDTEQLHIPSLLLQPIVENAIQHGLFPKRENGYLSVSFDLPANDTLIVKVEDNGIGRNNANEQKKIYPGNKVSYGTNLVKDLITIFQNYELLDIDITYTDKTAPLSGTIVTITIKYNHERIQLHNSR